MCERDATNKAERIQQKAERGPAREIYNIICLNAKKSRVQVAGGVDISKLKAATHL